MGVGVSHRKVPGGLACDQNPHPLGPGHVSHFNWIHGRSPWKPKLKRGQGRGCSAKEPCWAAKPLRPGYYREPDTDISQLRKQAQREQVPPEKPQRTIM